MSFRNSLLTACCCVIFASATAHAQDTEADVQDVIVVTGQLSNFGATKSSAPILETARSVSVVTSNDFLARGALTLDDALNYSAGVVGDNFGFSTRGDFFAVRGLDVPEYRDNLQALFGNFNNTRPELYTVDQVEVLKGPASVLYGQGSSGGIVNLVSKRAGPDLGQEIVVSYGTHDRIQLSGDFNTTLIEDTLYARFVGVYRDSDTQVDFVEDNSVSLAPSLTWTPAAGTEINLLVNYDERDGDTAHQFLPLSGTLNPGPNGQRMDAGVYHGEPGFNTYETESTAITIIGSHQLNDVFTLEGTARWRDSSSEYRQAWISFNPTGGPRLDANGNGFRTFFDSPASSEQLALDARLRADFITGEIEHEILVGVNYQNVELDGSRAGLGGPLLGALLNAFDPVYGFQPPQGLLDSVRELNTSESEYWGFYLHDQMSWNNWIFNIGVRVDGVDNDSINTPASGPTTSTSQDDDATTFSTGLLYAFDNGFSPYISYAESFDPVIGPDTITNNPLKPREGEQIEVGVKYQPVGTRTYFTLAYFDISETNLPNPQSLQGVATSQQEGESSIKGFELEAQTYLDMDFGELQLFASASLLDAEDPNGLQLSSIPEEQFAIWAQFQPAALADLRLGFGVRHAGNNKSFGINRENPLVPRLIEVETDGYTVADALIGYDFENWSATLNVRNLFDEQYQATCLARGDCFPGEERTINLRVARQF